MDFCSQMPPGVYTVSYAILCLGRYIPNYFYDTHLSRDYFHYLCRVGSFNYCILLFGIGTANIRSFNILIRDHTVAME